MYGLLGSPARNILVGAIYMVVVIILTTAAYVAAGWTLNDALYMVILTVYTVGYDEVRSVDTPLLRIITMATIVFGCTGMIFLTGSLIQIFTISQLQQFLGVKRMKSQIDQLNGHVIICGYGRIGMTLARELRAGGAKFVILERGEGRLTDARNLDYLCIQGDATNEETLVEAGIMRARLLATVLPDDAANVFITLSARSLNKSLTIIARGEVPSTESKLLQAGADKVVMPTHIGAERIAEMILYADMARFLRDSEKMRAFEKTLHSLGLELETIVAADGGQFTGLTVEEIERQMGLLIVRVDRGQDETIMAPSSHTRVAAGDGIVYLARNGQVGAINKLFDMGF